MSNKDESKGKHHLWINDIGYVINHRLNKPRARA